MVAHEEFCRSAPAKDNQHAAHCKHRRGSREDVHELQRLFKHCSVRNVYHHAVLRKESIERNFRAGKRGESAVIRVEDMRNLLSRFAH